MPEFTTIHEQVKAAKAGDQAAWSTLYHHYYAGLYAAALTIHKNISAAEDAVHDAFILAYMKLHQLKEVAAFGSWMKQILIHSGYRVLHRSSVMERMNDALLESDTWWEDELNRKLEILSTEGQLYTVIAQLPEVLRSTLLLRYFSGFQSYEEIASILSIPVGTVRSRLNQAKLKLAEQWQLHEDSTIEIFKQSQEWNHFYQTSFTGMHYHDEDKNRFVAHLQSDVRLILSGGKQNTGPQLFEKMIVEDREAGSWLTPTNVTSCGNISIIEARHFNSPENPAHCPPRSVLVLYRNKQKVDKMSFYVSLQ
jgi:RNA polymerase sigma factor (sigma-70 family)